MNTGLAYTENLKKYLDGKSEIFWNLEESTRILNTEIYNRRKDERRKETQKEFEEAVKILNEKYKENFPTHEAWMANLLDKSTMEKLRMACGNRDPRPEQICAAIRMENAINGKFYRLPSLQFIDLIPGAGKTALEILPALLVKQEKIVLVATSLQLVSQTIASTAANAFSDIPYPFLVRRVDGGVEGSVTANFKKGIFLKSEFHNSQIDTDVSNAIAQSRGQTTLAPNPDEIYKALSGLLKLPGSKDQTVFRAKLIVGTYEGIVRVMKEISLDDIGCLVVDEWDELVASFKIGKARADSRLCMQALITACCKQSIPVFMMSGTGDFKLNSNFSFTPTARPQAEEIARKFITDTHISSTQDLPRFGFTADSGPMCLSSFLGMQYASLITFNTPIIPHTLRVQKSTVEKLAKKYSTHLGALMLDPRCLNADAKSAISRLLQYMMTHDDEVTAVFVSDKVCTYTESLMIALALRENGFPSKKIDVSDLPFENPLKTTIVNSLETRKSNFKDIAQLYLEKLKLNTATEIYQVMLDMGVFPINAENISNNTISILMNERKPRVVVTTSKLGSGVDFPTIGATVVINAKRWGVAFKDIIQWLARGYRNSDDIFRVNFAKPMESDEKSTPESAAAELKLIASHTLSSSFFHGQGVTGSIAELEREIRAMVGDGVENSFIIPNMHLEASEGISSVDVCWLFDTEHIPPNDRDRGVILKAFTALNESQSKIVREVLDYSPVYEKFLYIDSFLADMMVFCSATPVSAGLMAVTRYDSRSCELDIGGNRFSAPGLALMTNYFETFNPSLTRNWTSSADIYNVFTPEGSTQTYIQCSGTGLSEDLGMAFGNDPLLAVILASVAVFASSPQKTFTLPLGSDVWTAKVSHILADVDRVIKNMLIPYAIPPDFENQLKSQKPTNRLYDANWNFVGMSGLWNGLVAVYLFKNRGNPFVQQSMPEENVGLLPAFVYAVIEGCKFDFIRTLLPYVREEKQDKEEKKTKKYVPKKELGAESLVYEFLAGLVTDTSTAQAPRHRDPALAFFMKFKDQFAGWFNSHKTEHISLTDRFNYLQINSFI